MQKTILIIVTVVLVGCGESQQSSEAKPDVPIAKEPAQSSSPRAEAKPIEPVPEAAQLLRDAKAPNSQANRALSNAAFVGDIEAVKQHLAASSDVNKKDEEGATPLHYAVSEGHREIVKLLIKKGADLNAKDMDGWIPLLYATAEGQVEVVDLLIAAGADVNTKDGDGDTPLDWAIIRNHTETADLLLKHGGKTGEELLMPRLSDIRTYWERVQLAELVINGKVGLKCGVLYSTDLKEWHVLDTVTLEASPQVYVDKSAEQCPHWCLQPMRFYRVKLVE